MFCSSFSELVAGEWLVLLICIWAGETFAEGLRLFCSSISLLGCVTLGCFCLVALEGVTQAYSLGNAQFAISNKKKKKSFHPFDVAIWTL